MFSSNIAATVIAATLLFAGNAKACLLAAKTNLDDVSFADLVVIGEITDYEIVKDQEIREQRRKQIERCPELKEFYGKQKSFITDYARFTVKVGKVLQGEASDKIEVAWNNSTFGEPDSMSRGPFLIALRKAGGKLPPLRGPSATVFPDPNPKLWNVLQARCAPPFIFKTSSASAKSIIQKLVVSQN
ncbi:hypothetical protein PsAD13_05319 [Pseudovibrio sp. Ad13]|uniref:hypothetical protein n=1 Tax=Pseudovibrio sp. Ad13 TaxID=989396 RepID=UPI0007B27F6C|nr:hypothetical protein [Pseudovibrio sp. Ad13]KZK75881.1 hypothetical protein PsAD13_05319 [Pseudovibrio sp. Ad13]